MTPPQDDQLEMTGCSDGWHRLRDGRDTATIVYVAERGDADYERSVFFPYGHVQMTAEDFTQHVCPRLDALDVPGKWEEEMDQAGSDEAREEVVARINEVYDSARVGGDDL